jgi:hypothetical protein
MGREASVKPIDTGMTLYISKSTSCDVGSGTDLHCFVVNQMGSLIIFWPSMNQAV